jgi:hypothetical protein
MNTRHITISSNEPTTNDYRSFEYDQQSSQNTLKITVSNQKSGKEQRKPRNNRNNDPENQVSHTHTIKWVLIIYANTTNTRLCKIAYKSPLRTPTELHNLHFDTNKSPPRINFLKELFTENMYGGGKSKFEQNFFASFFWRGWIELVELCIKM